MLIAHHQLLHLPVYTQNNTALGKIHGFDIEVESQSILKYHVGEGSILKDILGQKLLINRGQVVSITSDRMTVEDAVLKEVEKKKKKSLLPDPGAEVASLNTEREG